MANVWLKDYMKDWVLEMEKKLSNINPNRRIVYFCSENRKIIQDVAESCLSICSFLGIKSCEAGTIYKNNFLDFTSCFDPKGNRKNQQITNKLLCLTDFHLYKEAYREKLIKAFLDDNSLEEKKIILFVSAPMVLIPEGFSYDVEVIKDCPYSESDIMRVISHRLKQDKKRNAYLPSVGEDKIREAARRFTGLTNRQIIDVLDSMKGSLARSLRENLHISLIDSEREKQAEKDNTIRFIELKAQKITGLDNYIDWLKERKIDYEDPVSACKKGTPPPKGVLFCGVPGTGKTAMAMETAKILKVPLIQFDISKLMNSGFGESEARMQRYLDRINAFGSCVLLMDEIEKTFSINEHTHEVKIAMLGQLLNWMQEHKANVFMFITANNITNLPAELLRDGRISGKFFAFMPSCEDLAKILCAKLSAISEESPDMFSKDFIAKLKCVRNGTSDKYFKNNFKCFTDIFDRIAIETPQLNENRLCFMTGANLVESLIEMTNRSLRQKKQVSVEEYSNKMVSCSLSEDFVPQAQSNLKNIVDLWLNAQPTHYQSVSKNMLLPFNSFDGKKFNDKFLPEPKYDYDKQLREIMKTAIEKQAEINSKLKPFNYQQQ